MFFKTNNNDTQKFSYAYKHSLLLIGEHNVFCSRVLGKNFKLWAGPPGAAHYGYKTDLLPIYIVIVSPESADVILGNEKTVKVLLHSNHRTDAVIDREERVTASIQYGCVEIISYAFFDEAQRMVFLVVKLATHAGKNLWRDCCHVIPGERQIANGDCFNIFFADIRGCER